MNCRQECPVEEDAQAEDINTLQEAPPEHLVCPITSDVMTDPVLAADGESYERSAIETWIHNKTKEIMEAQDALRVNEEDEAAQRIVKAGVISPMGFGRLVSTSVTPNRALARLAQEWKAFNKKRGK